MFKEQEDERFIAKKYTLLHSKCLRRPVIAIISGHGSYRGWANQLVRWDRDMPSANSKNACGTGMEPLPAREI
jgi:hypothetical protein